MEEKDTDDLQQELMGSSDIQAYLSENESRFVEADVLEQLEWMRRRSGLSKAALARKADMSEVYLYQVLASRRTASRDRLLCLCIALGASLEEVQRLLKRASCAQLYPRVRRDAIISHGLIHRRSLQEVNETLFAANEQSLS
ncbi:MAG: helix-turn-helix domain-containing protein [Oscillospiraceae bacterium]|nr:helix-turn-helix domain-containing protein [Oscillospiraceae bacterium]